MPRLLDMANADQIPVVDEVLAEKYRIERVLGRGGMGIVLAAMHLKLDERVAIKFLLPELASDPTLVARFVREGRAAIKIRSEHVVRVLDVATLPGGTPYLVMEYLEGRNFEELLEDQGRLPAELVVDHLLQAAEALAEAHALGMVHRDLKPANLFLAHRVDGSPCVKVLDFGITKVLEAPGALNFDMTKTSVVMGSPRYMSPEQMRSTRAIDARADIWAIGVILEELITGFPPFDGTTMPDLVAAILQDPPPLLRQLRPEAPEALERIISKCLEKDPSARYADIAELAQALAPFGSTSAHVSAERVSRVMRPRGAVDTSTSAPIVRNALLGPSLPAPSSAFPPEPPTAPNVTVSATANVLAKSGARLSAATVRTAALALGGVFFAVTLVVAVFRGGERRPTSVAAVSTETRATPASALSIAPKIEAAFPKVDLVPAASAAPFDAFTTPSATPSTLAPAKRAHPPAGPKNDPDLFDGRK